MANAIQNQRVRLALDLTQWLSTPTDVITSESPTIANGVDLQFELAFSYGALTSDAQLVDVSSWASVTIALKGSNNRSGLPYWSRIIPAASLNNTLSFSNWEAGTDQNCIIQIPSSQNQLVLVAPQVAYWLEIAAQTISTDTQATAIAIVSGGTGYTAGDVLSASGGTQTQLVAIQVDTVSSGVITAAHIVQPGRYQVQPGNAVQFTGGTGSSATFNLTWTRVANQIIPVATFPVSVIDAGIYITPPPFVVIPTFYTAAQSDARYLLATDLSNKASLAGATFTGAVVLASGQMSGATGLYATTKTYVDAGDAATAAAAVPIAGATSITGAKTFSALLTASAGLTTTGAVTLGSLAGVLKSAAGVVSGGATTADLTEGSNLYFTAARAIAAALTGYTATTGTIAATDTILQAIQKIGYYIAHAPAGATVYSVASQAAMLALGAALKGDMAYRSDTNTVFVLGGGSPATLGSWNQWLYPVLSVNGVTGAVVLTTTAITEGTNLYYTDVRADARIANARGTPSGICPLDSTSFVPWVNLPPLTGYASGAGVISATDTILTAIQKLNGNTAAVSASTLLLTGYTSGAGTVSATDSILQAIQKLNGNVAAITNPITAVLTGYTSGAGTISSSDTILSAIQKLNGNDGLKLNLAGGTLTGAVLNSGGYFDAGAAYGYKLNGTAALYLSSSRPLLDLSGGFAITTTGSFATMILGYSGAGIEINQSNELVLPAVLKMTTHKVIDQNNYYFDLSGNQILNSQQGAVTNASAASGTATSGGYGFVDATEFNNFITSVNGAITQLNSLLAKARTHGLIAT